MPSINSPAQISYLQGVMRKQNTQLAKLQSQQSTGQIATDFAGLNPTESNLSITMRAQLQRNKIYQQNVSYQQIINKAINNSLTGLSTAVVATHDDSLKIYTAIGTDNGAAIRSGAVDKLDTAIGFLNQQVNGTYIFGGRVNKPPVKESTELLADLRAAVNTALAAAPTPGRFSSVTEAQNAINGFFATAATVGTTVTADTSVAGLAKWGPKPEAKPGEPIAIGDDQSIAANLGVVPNATRDGNGITDTATGLVVDRTYMAMDSLRAIAGMATITMADFNGDKSLYTNFVAEQLKQLNFANKEVLAQTAVSGQQGAALETQANSLTAQNTVLKSNISTIESVDMATIITNLQNLQTQLQSTYQVTAALKNLSLASILSF